MTRKDLFDLKKEVLFRALDRNLEWAKRTNETSMQVKKWAIAFSTVFVGLWLSDRRAAQQIQPAHYAVGLTGIIFFAFVDALQHYYSFLLHQGRWLMESLEKLHRESDEELRELWPKTANVVWSTARKFKNYAKMFTHETLWAFYGGLSIAMVAVLRTLRS